MIPALARSPKLLLPAVILVVALAAGGMYGLRGWLVEQDLSVEGSKRDTVSHLPDALDAYLTRAGFQVLSRPSSFPDASLRNRDDRPARLIGSQNRWVLVYCWFSNCLPCIKELPNLAELAPAALKRGLRIVSLCVQANDPGEVRDLVKLPEDSPLPVLYDPTGKVRRALEIQVSPTVFLVDPQGWIVARTQGLHPKKESLNQLLDALPAPAQQ
jgi:thiol-disulfide isomerase/thioredoxin